MTEIYTFNKMVLFFYQRGYVSAVDKRATLVCSSKCTQMELTVPASFVHWSSSTGHHSCCVVCTLRSAGATKSGHIVSTYFVHLSSSIEDKQLLLSLGKLGDALQIECGWAA